LLLSEILPPGCEKAHASNVLFVSPVAKSPFGSTFLFLHKCQCCGVVCMGLARMFAGLNSARFDPAKDSTE